MAETTTFTTLKEDVRRYLERGSVSDPVVYEQLPRLINLAERRIARELKVQGFIRAVTTNLVPGDNGVLAKPDRWRETISINIGTGEDFTERKFLLTRSYEYLRSYWPDESQRDEPLFYGDYNYENWLIVPTPDRAYPAEILYYQLLPLLDETEQTNWLTDYAPQLLLYGALLEATPFLKADERIPVWQDMYDRAAGMLNGEDVAKIIDRSATRKEA